MNNPKGEQMKKAIIYLCGIVLAGAPVWAAEVVSRMSCTELKQEIDSLDASDERLVDLRARHRRQCSVGTPKRRATRTAVLNPDAVGTDCDALQSQINTAADAAKTSTDAIATLTELRTKYDTECGVGCVLDEYGCCAGETYTDMGEAGFNCCPDDGGDCFPPM